MWRGATLWVRWRKAFGGQKSLVLIMQLLPASLPMCSSSRFAQKPVTRLVVEVDMPDIEMAERGDAQTLASEPGEVPFPSTN